MSDNLERLFEDIEHRPFELSEQTIILIKNSDINRLKLILIRVLNIVNIQIHYKIEEFVYIYQIIACIFNEIISSNQEFILKIFYILIMDGGKFTEDIMESIIMPRRNEIDTFTKYTILLMMDNINMVDMLKYFNDDEGMLIDIVNNIINAQIDIKTDGKDFCINSRTRADDAIQITSSYNVCPDVMLNILKLYTSNKECQNYLLVFQNLIEQSSSSIDEQIIIPLLVYFINRSKCDIINKLIETKHIEFSITLDNMYFVKLNNVYYQFNPSKSDLYLFDLIYKSNQKEVPCDIFMDNINMTLTTKGDYYELFTLFPEFMSLIGNSITILSF